MVGKVKQRTIHENAVLGDYDVQQPVLGAGTPGTGVVAIKGARSVTRLTLDLTNVAVAVDADDDFGGTLLLTLPNTPVRILGVLVDLVATAAGGFSTLANLDVAVGTVVTASADFSNAGEDNLVAKIDGTSGGVVAGGGAVPSSGHLDVAAAADNEIWVNVATGNIATDGTVTLNGTVTLLLLEVS